MDLEIIILSEVSQRKTNATGYHLYMGSKIWHKWTYLWNRNRSQTYRIDLRLPRERGGEEGCLKFGVSKCKLLYTEWIDKKVLLYSPGNYIWYPVINDNGKEYEKMHIYIHIHTHIVCMCVYVCIKLNHLAIQEKLTQYCKSRVLQ